MHENHASRDTNSDATLRDILQQARTIAVVGWSAKTDRPSNEVAAYLLANGYDVVGVNPMFAGQPGPDGAEPCYATLAEVPWPIDIVDVFRASDQTPPVASAAVEAGAKTLWLQIGIVNAEAGRIATDAGLGFVQDLCTRLEHGRLVASQR